MSKRGKEIKIATHQNYNIVCGTVDNKNAKAVYINISAWGEPNTADDLDYGRIISKLNKCVKQSTYNYLFKNHSDTFYADRTIVDLDMRESGIKVGKRSFMNCEMTLFQKINKESNGSINDGQISEILNGIINEAVSCLESFEHFDFDKKKN